MRALKEIKVEGLTLAVRTSGERNRPSLVLLHGWPQTSFAWEGVLGELGRDHYALAFDLPGVGGSRGAPRSAEKTVLADLILTAAEQAGAEETIIAGYDVGGMIAFAAARDHGARVKGAVVMNTVIPGLDPWAKVLADPRIFHFALHNVPKLPETLIAGRERPYFDFFYDVMAVDPKHLGEEARAAYVSGYTRPEALKAGLDWYRSMAKDAEHNAGRIPIATPLLYLRGDAGPASTTLDDYARGLRQAGAERLETGSLPHSGEYAPEEAPEDLVAALRRFRRLIEGGERMLQSHQRPGEQRA
ncbi:alpha/beta hydrolase [Mesorhizobium sp. B2-4-19]|nr:alpha/beta hydrolase [Mesorhizobium sp. B2-4-19]